MKKLVVVSIFLVLSVMFTASCSAAMPQDWAPPASAPAPAYAPGVASSAIAGGGAFRSAMMAQAPAAPDSHPVMAEDSEAQVEWSADYSVANVAGSGLVPITPPVADSSLAEKIIYTVTADIETLSYEETIAQVYELMAIHGAFIESSFVGGINLEHSFHGWSTMRHARFTLRVPTERLNAMTTGLETLGNVASLGSVAENITQQFTDTQSRLNSLRTQEVRLLEMLATAENIEDLLAIEDRLSWVRWEIESMTTTLRNWQTQIDYSTLHLHIREVEAYTLREDDVRTYWQRIGDGVVGTLRGIANFFMALLMWFVVNIPILVLIAVIVVVIILIIKRKYKKTRVPPQ